MASKGLQRDPRFSGFNIVVSRLVPRGEAFVLNSQALAFSTEDDRPEIIVRRPEDLDKLDPEEVKRMFTRMTGIDTQDGPDE